MTCFDLALKVVLTTMRILYIVVGKTYFSDPVRDDGRSDQGGSNEDGKWSDSGIFRKHST